MSDIVDQAKNYLKANAAESGADVLIEELVKELSRMEDWCVRAIKIEDENAHLKRERTEMLAVFKDIEFIVGRVLREEAKS